MDSTNDKLPTMSTELVKFEGESEDQFFGGDLIYTDWNEALQRPDLISMAAEIDAIKKYEPVTPGHPFEHQIWVHQQRLRIWLRHSQDLPLLGNTCKYCGSNREDPVLKECLVCAEFRRQVGHRDGRGSCFYLRPTWDVASKSWGLLYYNSYSSDDAFLLWIALGWKSCINASKAMMPVKRYEEWLTRKYGGMGGWWRLEENLLPFSQVMTDKKNLPWTPEQFETKLRQAIRSHMSEDHELLGWTVQRALDDYTRSQRD
jgi:hypothetical protein